MPSGVRVKRKDDPPREFFQQTHLVFGQCRTHRRNDVFVPGLMQRDDIEIAFNDDSLICSANGFSRAVEAVEQSSLGEDRGFG